MKIRSKGFKPMKARITRLRSFGYNNSELILLPNQKIGQQSVHVGSALTMKTKFMHAPRAYILTLTYSLIQPKAIWVLCWQCNTHRNDSVLKVNLDMVFRDSLHHRLKNVVTPVRNDVLPGEPLHQYISLQKLHPSQFRHRRPLRGKIRENKQHFKSNTPVAPPGFLRSVCKKYWSIEVCAPELNKCV